LQNVRILKVDLLMVDLLKSPLYCQISEKEDTELEKSVRVIQERVQGQYFHYQECISDQNQGQNIGGGGE